MFPNGHKTHPYTDKQNIIWNELPNLMDKMVELYTKHPPPKDAVRGRFPNIAAKGNMCYNSSNTYRLSPGYGVDIIKPPAYGKCAEGKNRTMRRCGKKMPHADKVTKKRGIGECAQDW
jgi:hypothetical protein